MSDEAKTPSSSRTSVPPFLEVRSGVELGSEASEAIFGDLGRVATSESRESSPTADHERAGLERVDRLIDEIGALDEASLEALRYRLELRRDATEAVITVINSRLNGGSSKSNSNSTSSADNRSKGGKGGGGRGKGGNSRNKVKTGGNKTGGNNQKVKIYNNFPGYVTAPAPTTPEATPPPAPTTPEATPPPAPTTPEATPPPIDDFDFDRAERELSELSLELESARDDYARQTAIDRKKFWSRFLESDHPFFSRFIKKIPLARGLAGFINRNATRHRDMDEARARYETTLSSLKERQASLISAGVNRTLANEISGLRGIESALRSQGINVNDLIESKRVAAEVRVRAGLIDLISQEDIALEELIVHHRGRESKGATRFTNWWARQKGVTGKLKKFGFVVGTGLLTGAGIATGGMLLGGIGAGFAATGSALFGAGQGLRLNRRLASSYIDKAKTTTKAQFESARDLEAKKQTRERAIGNGLFRTSTVAGLINLDSAGVGLGARENIVGGTEESTADKAKENRNRLWAMIKASALSGGVGARLVHSLLSDIINPPTSAKPTELPPKGDGIPPSGETPPGDTGGGVPHVGGHETLPVPNIDSYGYPWDWAAHEWGQADAMDKVVELADRAREAGYNVQWNNLEDGNSLNDWLSIEGNSNTAYVISILNQFR